MRGVIKMLGDYNVSFCYRNENYSLRLSQEQKSDTSLNIGGVNYSILTDKGQLAGLKDVLSQLPSVPILSERDLAEKLSVLQGVSSVSVISRVNTVGTLALGLSRSSFETVAETQVTSVSHSSFNPETIIDELCDSLKTYYIFPEKVAACIEDLRGFNSKGISNPEELLEKVNAILFKNTKDEHLRMLFLTPEGAKEEDNFTMKAKMITADIGYIHMRGFGPVKTSAEENAKRSKS